MLGPAQSTHRQARELDFELMAFTVDLARARVRIVDLEMRDHLEDTLERTGAALVINGGFFHADGSPDGLAISGGRALAALRRDMSGGVLTIDEGRAELTATEDYDIAREPDFAVQCLPRLVVGGANKIARDDGRHADRTALCLRDEGTTLEVLITRTDHEGGHHGPTLHAFAGLLVERGCEAALNLDGGPSTGAAWRDARGVQAIPRRGLTRHALVFIDPT